MLTLHTSVENTFDTAHGIRIKIHLYELEDLPVFVFAHIAVPRDSTQDCVVLACTRFRLLTSSATSRHLAHACSVCVACWYCPRSSSYII